MIGDILFGYANRWLGTPPSPGQPAFAGWRTRLTAWLCAPEGRLFPHIRAGSYGAFRDRFFMYRKAEYSLLVSS